MSDIEFVSFDKIPASKFVELMNTDNVGDYLPLLDGEFTKSDCNAFLASKSEMWKSQGIGPVAILINNDFAGWGGFQLEDGEYDFALILHPDYWGYGRKIFDKFKYEAFAVKNLESITVLFPPNRSNKIAIKRLGFIEDKNVSVAGHDFTRYRLLNKKQ